MSERFARERVMHELQRRTLQVRSSAPAAPGMQRITLGGDELAGFATLAPGDHVKVFFPDPVTGEFTLPAIGGRGIRDTDGPGAVIVRDYTPFAFRPDAPGGPELDIDFYLHGDGGPASAWASRATAGDEIVIAGPRGSKLAPTDVDDAVIVADESALPAAARWLDTFAARNVPVTGLFSIADAATANYLSGYEGPGRTLRWFSGADRDSQLAAALRAVTPREGTFFFLAGEATALIPLRRHLRRDLGLTKDQVDAQGYWKRGVVALDHHAPLDLEHPDE